MALERTPRTLYLIERIIKDRPSPEERFLILNKIVALAGYELIALSKHPRERDRRRELLKADLADAAVQLQLLMQDLGFDPGEILKLGLEHTYERFQEFEDRGWSRK